eukprot:SAG31_NODE_20_length_34168_cov_33.651296_11_plen_75_part_00
MVGSLSQYYQPFLEKPIHLRFTPHRGTSLVKDAQPSLTLFGPPLPAAADEMQELFMAIADLSKVSSMWGCQMGS